MDTLQRLSVFFSYITEEHETHNGWITELGEAMNCDNKSEFSVETFKKPVKSVLVKHLYSSDDQ